MTPHHHLDETTLLRYASGGLSEAQLVVAATHIAMCSKCTHSVRLIEAVGGRLLESSAGMELSAGSFDRLMDKLSSAPCISRDDTREPAQTSVDVPYPLIQYIGYRLSDVSWKTVAPGVRKHDIVLKGSARTPQSLYLLYIDSGKAVPEHGHGGNEMTLVLSGAYQDSLGRFAPGDIADLDENIEHQPRVEPEQPCICLVATEAPTRFKGLFSRLLQPFVGI